MLEAKWEIDTEEGKGWDYTGNQPTLFESQKTNFLEEDLNEFMKSKTRFNGEIYEFTIKNGFLPRHTNEIFSNWQHSGKLEVLTSKMERARKGAFYIAYNYYRDDDTKTQFKLK